MNKKYIMLAGVLTMSMLAVGCGKKEEQIEPTPTPTPTQEASGDLVEMQKSTGIDKSKITKIMGTQSATASDVVITNNTGIEISSFYVRPSGEEDWSDDYIDSAFTLKDKEQALYYYDSNEKDDSGSTITRYDLRVSYADSDESDCLFRNLTLSDIEELSLNMEDGVPFVTYTSLSTKRQVSTLEDAKARMGRTDNDDEEDEDADETTTPTPTSTETATPTPTVTETPAPTETEAPSDSGDDGSGAGNYIGGSIDSLYNEYGGANSSEYETDPESGAEVGYYYYDGFTVSTIEQDGQEVITGVW